MSLTNEVASEIKVWSDNKVLLKPHRPCLGVMKDISKEDKTGGWSEIKIEPISYD